MNITPNVTVNATVAAPSTLDLSHILPTIPNMDYLTIFINLIVFFCGFGLAMIISQFSDPYFRGAVMNEIGRRYKFLKWNFLVLDMDNGLSLRPNLLKINEESKYNTVRGGLYYTALPNPAMRTKRGCPTLTVPENNAIPMEPVYEPIKDEYGRQIYQIKFPAGQLVPVRMEDEPVKDTEGNVIGKKLMAVNTLNENDKLEITDKNKIYVKPMYNAFAFRYVKTYRAEEVDPKMLMQAQGLDIAANKKFATIQSGNKMSTAQITMYMCVGIFLMCGASLILYVFDRGKMDSLLGSVASIGEAIGKLKG